MDTLWLPRWLYPVLAVVGTVGLAIGLLTDRRAYFVNIASSMTSFAAAVALAAPALRAIGRHERRQQTARLRRAALTTLTVVLDRTVYAVYSLPGAQLDKAENRVADPPPRIASRDSYVVDGVEPAAAHAARRAGRARSEIREVIRVAEYLLDLEMTPTYGLRDTNIPDSSEGRVLLEVANSAARTLEGYPGGGGHQHALAGLRLINETLLPRILGLSDDPNRLTEILTDLELSSFNLQSAVDAAAEVMKSRLDINRESALIRYYLADARLLFRLTGPDYASPISGITAFKEVMEDLEKEIGAAEVLMNTCAALEHALGSELAEHRVSHQGGSSP
jgi:hypothetical protein